MHDQGTFQVLEGLPCEIMRYDVLRNRHQNDVVQEIKLSHEVPIQLMHQT